MDGILNSRGSQFVRGVCFTRYSADEATGGPIQVAANSNYVVGFTSGVPGTETSVAGSGFTIPAEGVYRASAVVYVSGIAPGINTAGAVLPLYGIEFTLDSAPIFHSRRNIVAASGVGTPYVGLTKLETDAIFEARGGDVLRVLVRSNSAAGRWNMIGHGWYPGDALIPFTTPAAVLNVQRLPTTALDSETWLV